MNSIDSRIRSCDDFILNIDRDDCDIMMSYDYSVFLILHRPSCRSFSFYNNSDINMIVFVEYGHQGVRLVADQMLYRCFQITDWFYGKMLCVFPEAIGLIDHPVSALSADTMATHLMDLHEARLYPY